MADSNKDNKVHLPLRQPRRGVAGYRGGKDVVIHDANGKDVTKTASHPRPSNG